MHPMPIAKPFTAAMIGLAKSVTSAMALLRRLSGNYLDKVSDRVVRVGSRVLQIRPGAERVPLGIAGQHRAAYLAIGFQLRQRLDESLVVFLAPGIASLGSAEGQYRDVTAFFTEQRHEQFPLPPLYSLASG